MMRKITLALTLLLFLQPPGVSAQHKPLSRSDRHKLNQNFLTYASYGSPTYLKDLIENGAEIEYADETGSRALMWAARDGVVKNVQALLALAAKVDARDRSGRTALFYALEATNNRTDTIAALLAGGAQINASDRYGETPLKVALAAKEDELAAFLKSRGAHDTLVEAAFNGDLTTLRTQLANRANVRGLAASSALEGAIQCGHLDVLNLFLSHHADPNARTSKGQTLLIQAAAIGNLTMVKALLAQGAEIDAHDSAGYTALMSAGGEDYKQISRFLLEKGANINARDRAGGTLLIHTARGILPAMAIPSLLEKGAKPSLRDNRGDTALIHLAWWTQYDMIMGGKEESHAAAVKILTDRGADVNARGSGGLTALMRAAGWHHEPTLQALLACGARVDLQDVQGRTALTWAARAGQKDQSVQDLLNAGAQVGLTDAMLLEDFPRAREILAEGGDTTGRGPFGETLLMIAAEKGQSDIVQTLLERAVDVNARDTDGQTALLLAIAGRATHSIPGGHVHWSVTTATEARTQIIKALLAHHANPNVQNSHNDTALSIAQQLNIAPAAALLTRYGAKTRVVNDRPSYLAPHTPEPVNDP